MERLISIEKLMEVTKKEVRDDNINGKLLIGIVEELAEKTYNIQK